MATEIKASAISSSTGSWYQKLRAIQGRTHVSTSDNNSTTITQTKDPSVKSGDLAEANNTNTAKGMNNFIDAILALKQNTYLAHADWSHYTPSKVTQGTEIKLTSTYTKINNMLDSLDDICSNNKTMISGCSEWSQCLEDNECGTYGNLAGNTTFNYSTNDILYTAYDHNGVTCGVSCAQESNWAEYKPFDNSAETGWTAGCTEDRNVICEKNDYSNYMAAPDSCWQYDPNGYDNTTTNKTCGYDTSPLPCEDCCYCSDDKTSGCQTYGVVI